MAKKYIFEGNTYTTESAVRNAIFQKQRIAFGIPKDADEWLEYGVTYTEEDDVIDLDALKLRVHNSVKREFLNWRNNTATLVSSLGFVADSNERANTDIAGLLVVYADNQDAGITFRDANNAFHILSYQQLKVLQLEIIANGNFAYEQKWRMDQLVDAATTAEELNAIEIAFEGMDFS